MTRPASASCFMWCDTVGWASPTGSMRSQMQASPSGWAAISDSSRSRVGSARALNRRASCPASSTLMTAPAIDVLLSARRVGASGYAYGVDMTDEMLALARANAQRAGLPNVEFVKGTIEDVPLPDGAV